MPASVDKLASKPYSTTSRFATFIRLLQTSREKLTTCKKTKSHSVCMEEVMNPLNQGHLNKEEAFVYTAFFGLDRSQGLMNSEFLMHPYLDKEHSRFDQKAVQLACKLIDENISNTFDFAIKALQYCTDMSTATKGTDQN